jgi:hypothetical protein
MKSGWDEMRAEGMDGRGMMLEARGIPAVVMSIVYSMVRQSNIKLRDEHQQLYICSIKCITHN